MKNKEKNNENNIFKIKKVRLLILSFSYPICKNCNTVKVKNNNEYCTWCGFQISRVSSNK